MSTERIAILQNGSRSRPALRRLEGQARMYLHSEESAWPGHFGGLAIVDGAPLLDPAGQLRLAELRERLALRLARVPELRRRLWFPGFGRGAPVWVDDPEFDITHHVLERAVDPPGDEAALHAAALDAYGRLLDRTRPLWELWFLTGLPDGRVGVLLKLHHCLADGSAVVRCMGSLFDGELEAMANTATWVREPIPDDRTLLSDNLAGAIRSLRRVAAVLAHPRRFARGARTVALVTRRSTGDRRAPRTSLNWPVGPARRVAALRFDLATMKQLAHAHGGTLNDLVLDLWSGGLRQLLASRDELVAGLEPVASQAVSTRRASDGAIDNRVGNVVLPLPVWEADPGRRLETIVRTTRRAKAEEQPKAVADVIVRLATSPLGHHLALHQQAANVKVTNVVGPRVPMGILGARVLDILPITQLLGNIGLSLGAFSYAGRMTLAVTADGDRFPDLDVLMRGMDEDWRALAGDHRERDCRKTPGNPALVSPRRRCEHEAGGNDDGCEEKVSTYRAAGASAHRRAGDPLPRRRDPQPPPLGRASGRNQPGWPFTFLAGRGLADIDSKTPITGERAFGAGEHPGHPPNIGGPRRSESHGGKTYRPRE